MKQSKAKRLLCAAMACTMILPNNIAMPLYAAEIHDHDHEELAEEVNAVQEEIIFEAETVQTDETEAAKINAVNIETKDGETVHMPYDLDGNVRYDELKKRIFEAAVISADPGISYENVEFKYAVKVLTKNWWIDLEGGKILGQTIGAISVGNNIDIQILQNGKELAKTVINIVDGRTTSKVILKEGVSMKYSMNLDEIKVQVLENVIDFNASVLPKGELGIEDFTFEYEAQNILGENAKAWVPFEGKKILVVDYPAISAGEQKIHVTYNGDEEFLKSEVSDAVTINVEKASVKVKVGDEIIHALEQPSKDFITFSPADEDISYFTVYAGANIKVQPVIYLDLPAEYQNGTVLKLIDPVLKAITGQSLSELMSNGMTFGELKELFTNEKLIDVLKVLGVDTGVLEQILKVINALPGIFDNVQIKFGIPNQMGAWATTVITADKNYKTAVGIGSLVVKNHVHLEVVLNSAEAKCGKDGYTGDLVCAICDKVLKEGDVIKADPHVPVTVNAADPTCTEDGYTGDEVCKVCNEVVKKGEVIKALGHKPILKNVKVATCTEDGYTGDLICTVCGDVVKEGKTIKALGHTIEIFNKKDATCFEEGYTGDEVCTITNETLKKGEPIAVKGHSWKVSGFQMSEDRLTLTVNAFCADCGEERKFEAKAEIEETADEYIYHYAVDVDGFTFKHTEKVKRLPFVDVKLGIWYYPVIAKVYEAGIMTGLDATHFGPNLAMTRGMAVTVLYRLEGRPTPNVKENFIDVNDNLWYTDPVSWAVEAGITTGYHNRLDGYFGPDDMITREQLATMIYRYLNYKGVDTSARGDLSKFDDAAQVSGFAKEAMQFCVGAGIITGADNGTKLAPLSPATRAECAKLVLMTFLRTANN